MNKNDYRFENVIVHGKNLNFTVNDAINFNNAIDKAVKYILKKFKIGKDEFSTQKGYLYKNIEKGITKVNKINIPEQLSLNFNETWENMYSGLFNEDIEEDAHHDFYDRYERIEGDILLDYINDAPKIKWKVIDANRLIKIWKDFADSGIIRDEKGLQQIKEMVLNNIARLRATNNLLGHLDFGESPDEILKKHGLEGQITLNDDAEFPENFYWEYMEPANSEEQSSYISDYGYPQLEKLYSKVYKSEGEDLLYAIDKVLNVVHQRGDLSLLFVKGGQNTLNKIANYQGKDNNEY